MRKIMSLVGGALAVVGIAGVMTACTPTINCADLKSRFADRKATEIAVADAEKTVFCLTNDQRKAAGVAELTWSTLLNGTARNHANDAVTRKWWVDGADTHTNPDGQSPSDRIRAAGYCPSGTWRTAENTYWAWGSASPPLQTPRAAVNWWMGSTLHRANILDSRLKELGVGVAKGAPRPGSYPEAAVFVQNFAACT